MTTFLLGTVALFVWKIPQVHFDYAKMGLLNYSDGRGERTREREAGCSARQRDSEVYPRWELRKRGPCSSVKSHRGGEMAVVFTA